MTSSVVEQIESFDAEKTFEAFKRSITCTENGSDARTRLEELREQVLEVKSAVQTSKCRTLKQGLERELWTPTAMITNRLLELDEALEEKQRNSSSMYLEYRMCSLNQLTAEVKIQLDVIQNLMIGPNSNSGTDLSNLCQVWHDQMYERMFQSGKVGIYSMSDYLRDFDDRLALIFCHFRAAVLLLTAGAGDAYQAQQSKDSALKAMNTIKAHAYSCFPPVIRALKRSYDDTERRTRWWRLETSTTTVPSKTLRSLTVHGIVQRWPEGRAVVSYMNINRHMPECEWTFDPACHPLDGPCTLISRCQGKPLQVEGKDSRDNDSRPTETSAWYSVGARSQPRWKLARFNLLPIASTDKRFYLFPVDDMPVNEDISTSVGDGSHPVDGFVNFWDWKTLSNTIWTLRDEDIEQSNTVMTDNRQMIEWSEWNHGSGVQYDL